MTTNSIGIVLVVKPNNENNHEQRQLTRALVYSSHLSTLGSWSRLALGLAHTLNRLMPTELATPTFVSAHVGQWTAGLNLVPYEREMAKDYDLLWNVDIFSYAEPVAKRKLA